VILRAYLSYALSVHLGIDLFVDWPSRSPPFLGGVVVERSFSRVSKTERVVMSILVTYASRWYRGLLKHGVLDQLRRTARVVRDVR